MFHHRKPPGVKFATRGPARRSFLIAFTAALAIGTYWFSRAWLDELAARSLAVFVVAAVFWATETLPLFATAFVVIGMEIVFLATDGGLAIPLTKFLNWIGIDVMLEQEISASQFFAPFAKDIIILFMGGFLLSRALTKHYVDVAVARRILRPFARSPVALLFAVLFISAFFSMWMSNTATTAMMLAIVAPVIAKFPEGDRFHRGIVLAVAFGANVGGIGTPIGTPPNAIAYGALNAAGFEVTFLQWMLVAVPLEFVLLIVAGTILYLSFKPEPDLDISPPQIEHEITMRGWMTVVILLLTIALWLTSGLHGVAPGAVALLATAAMASLAVIDRHDVDSIDWNILILMWGGLSLSVALTASGLDDVVAHVNFNNLPGGGWLAGILVAAIAVTLSTFMSNTATASILIPMALAVSISHREQYAMLAAFACSFAMAMPVSTPPNAMAYATGKVPAISMLRTGLLITIISVLLLLSAYRVMLPMIFAE